MSKKWLLSSVLLCLAVVGVLIPGLTRADQETGDDVLLKMEGEGWRVVQEGVLQRELKVGEIESFVFGVKGFQWKLRDLQARLVVLQNEFRARPTADLQRTIANHRKEIANTRRMIAVARAAEASGVSDPTKVDCSITFSYDATAGHGASTQGTWGKSKATFAGNCGFTGEVYAYAFAKTTVNGAPTTHTVTDGPRSGANVSANAHATVNGGPLCESNSYASMTSYNLNPSSYSMSANNPNYCPGVDVPPSVSISSDYGTPIYLWDGDCAYITWTASVSGGTPAVSTKIYINNILKANGTSHSEYVCGGTTNSSRIVTARADVVDGIGRTATASHSTTVYSRISNPCYSSKAIQQPCN